MTLREVKTALNQLKTVHFKLPNGDLVPAHFHVTEIGKINKHFIDCGGTIRTEESVSFQLWNANDYNHRLHPEKLSNIINLSIAQLKIDENLPVEVEYQGETIGKFGLEFNGHSFLLTSKHTDCLAKDNCGIPLQNLKPKLKLSELQQSMSCCSPDSGCC